MCCGAPLVVVEGQVSRRDDTLNVAVRKAWPLALDMDYRHGRRDWQMMPVIFTDGCDFTAVHRESLWACRSRARISFNAVIVGVAAVSADQSQGNADDREATPGGDEVDVHTRG